MITPKITNLGYSNLWADMSTILGYTLNFEKLIAKLFSNNEQGFFHDPNDLSTMFQDAAGTVPVTAVGQPVGLVLDKSKNLSVLGSAIDDTSLNNQSAWVTNNEWTVSGGKASATNASVGIYQNSKIVTGRLYRATVTVNLVSGSLYLPYDGSSGNQYRISSSGTYVRYFIGTLSPAYVAFGDNFTGDISKLSVELINSNSSRQTTSSMRPLLQDTPRRIQCDGIDDRLTTALSAQLTGCTVIRAVPNVGTQILTNQTIPASYNDSTNHCGLIVVNRALTPIETSVITSEFNKRAGV